MDFINKFTGENKNAEGQSTQPAQKESFTDKMNGMMGGGKEGEKKEDYLDKGVDTFQQYVLHEGSQDSESAVEQAKDEQISDAIRRAYHGATGKDVPIKDKS